MATRRTATRSTRTTRRTGAHRRAAKFSLPPEVIRGLVGLALMLAGATILIPLLFRGGTLTDWLLHTIAPWFGTARWLLPLLLLAWGTEYLYRPRSRTGGPELTIASSIVAYVGLLGLMGLVAWSRAGVVGQWLADTLTPLITGPGSGLVFMLLFVTGTLVALDVSFPSVGAAVVAWFRASAAVLFRPRPEQPRGGREPAKPAAEKNGRDRAAAIPDNGRRRLDQPASSIPVAVPSAGPFSATFAPAVDRSTLRDAGFTQADAPVHEGTSVRDGQPLRGRAPGAPPSGEPGEEGAAEAAPETDGVTAEAGPPPRPEYKLPPLALLEDIAPRNGDSTMDHERNAAIIEAKLSSFNIPARVVAWNAGPVVTQYEVEPAPEIKVSRIEALSDDLAMALAARTIRIEAPIPGKSVVGIEIPNKDFNIVALRRILQEVDFAASTKLTFALGRDVAGHARAADLAKMPHLLIAGATGSGKSVMVNALITSLLCKATPYEVRMVLVDLKRVELSAYNGLPHLMVPVITEPERAKAALKWAVAEMENRYRRFAGASARNLAGFNETRADPADRLPYLVIIVDELADLMMREGRNIEDPIVRLAQKARATGIHMVLATQRPSVNVVTGLIKANFPSRIAFAMASQIDSRTILDMPGAEDLIGRGDMLFQPADLPRPIRLQGVFVSDREIASITGHWRAEAEPHYDMGIIESDEESSGGTEEIGEDADADRLLPDAVAVIEEYDRASASLLQRRLKIGYARAARIIDQLEARGYIGAFDGSNARQVLRRDSGTAAGRGEEDA